MPSMSRPNSRVDNHKVVHDLSNEHAQATTAVNQDDQEAEQMRQAIAMSLGQDAPPPQENGVTGTGQQFGPATRDHYEASQWAMTAPISSYRELIDHPPPSKRRRLDGQPAFLRGAKETGYLAPLLTIYHGIPLAREALLLPPMKVMSYGHDQQWWAGQSDENRKSLTLEVDQHVDRSKLNLLAEIQCLMAFLDGTKRAYGSVDALADLQGLKTFRAETSFSRLTEAWRDAAMSQCGPEQLTQVFSSTAVKAEGTGSMSKDMVCLEPPVNRSPDQSLVELLDTTVWNDNVEALDDIWFQHCGEVFTVRMYDPGNRDEGLQVTAAPFWYSDRYLEERKSESREIRAQLQAVRKEMNQYSNLQKRCEFVSGPDRKPIRVKEALGAVSQASMAAMADRYTQYHQTSDLTKTEIGQLGPDVQAIMERIDQKLRMLEEAKSKLIAKMREISTQMTQPTEDPSSPIHKYLLMGVSTRPETTYLRRESTDLLGLEEETGAELSKWQWWRTSSSTEHIPNPPPAPVIGPATQDQAEAAKKKANGNNDNWGNPHILYTVVQVGEEDVIEAIRSEYNSVVLVYANEHAVEWKATPASEALRKFVAQDNSEFASEMREETEPASIATPQNSDATFEDVALEDIPTGQRLACEMAPMSINSPYRDEDGQPSPKRPKSSDGAWRPARDDEPPPYEDALVPEMQERKQHKIGMYAEQMLEKYGQGGKGAGEKPEALHLEHSMDLPR